MARWIAAVRHPEKQDDVDGIHRGDASLITEKGEQQAEVIIKRALNMDLDAVLSSDVPRTALLATRIGEATKRPVITNAAFREWRKPSFMLGRSKADEDVRNASKELRERFDEDIRLYDEETKPELLARTRLGKKSLLDLPFDRVLLVTHAKYLCGLVTETVWGSLDGFYQGPDATLKLDHTGVTIFVNEPDRRTGKPILKVKTVNDVSHQETEFFQQVLRIFDAPA